MKPLLKLQTYINAAAVETISKFMDLNCSQGKTDSEAKVVIKFADTKSDDGTWERDYFWEVNSNTQMPVYYFVDGVRQPLLRGEVPVMTDEFTYIRFMCWDNNFVSLKKIIGDGVVRRKAKDLSIQNGEPQTSRQLTLPPFVTGESFIEYIDDIHSE